MNQPELRISSTSNKYHFGLVVLTLLAIIALWLGVSWRMGWFPFRPWGPTEEERVQALIESTTATGPSTLSPSESAALTKSTTATGPSTLSPSEEAALIESTTAH